MMKKKVKKIPKYNVGGSVLDTLMKNNALKGNPITFNPAGYTNDNSTNNFSKFSNWKGTSANPWKDMTSAQKTGAVIDAVGAIGQGLGVATSGQDVNVGTALNTAASMAGAGMTIGGPIGAGVGAGVGLLMGTAGRKAGYDADSSSTRFDDIYDPGSGWLGLFSNKNKAQRKANIVQNSNISKIQSENIKEMYYSDPNVTLQPTTAAEGGIMRQPVDALVSKGELIYNPMTKKLSKVPGSKGKPNKADDVYARLYEGDVVISNSPTMLMANGKTPAQNLEGLVDKYATGGTVKAREAIIKKVVNWQEANKTKPQEYAKFKDGWNGEIKTWDDYLKYQYNLSKGNKIDSLDNFWGYDSKNKKYTSRWDKIIKHIGENKELREKAIKDLSGLGYVGTGKDAWDNIVKAAYDTKPADVHRYFKSVGDVLQTNEDALKPVVGIRNVISVPKGISQKTVKSSIDGVDIVNSYVPQQESEKLVAPPLKKVYGLTDTYDKYVDDAYRSLQNRKRYPKLRQLGENILDFAPLAAALFGDYDYHTESSQISPDKYIPTGVSKEPMRRAANESYAMARYNQANISPNTGAGMAYGLQAASNRAKALADAYTWQQDAQNKLIAQNVGIYNDWRKQRDAYATQAIADTRANEGAAQQMRDSAIRDAYEFMAGRRNDRMRLAMMEPLAKYAFDDDTYKKIYSRAIV